MEKWDKRFFELALHVAEWSRDPKTKVGAVIVNNHKQVVSLGFNGFPRGIFDREDRYEDRETKYMFVAHAERNALDNAFVDTRGCTLYTTLYPCNECAKGIIQKGIKRVVAPIPDFNKPSCNFNITKIMFEEAAIQTNFV
jgi:dCMP deaminase